MKPPETSAGVDGPNTRQIGRKPFWARGVNTERRGVCHALQHRTLFYGEYSSRVRGCGEPTKPAAEVGEEHRPRRRTSPNWGRLIAKIYHVDPLVCTRCGKRMSVVAFVTDSAAVGKILDHLGLTNSEAEKPPPPRHERLRVAEHGDGWGVPQEWE